MSTASHAAPPPVVRPWVSAVPFRAQLHHLMVATELPWRAIALYAELPPGLVRRLAGPTPPRRIPHEVGATLLQVRIAELEALRRQFVPATPTIRRLNQLRCVGIDTRTLAQMMQLSVERLESLRNRGRRCSRRTDLLARCAVQAHHSHTIGSQAA